jgi:hypothetical protein
VNYKSLLVAADGAACVPPRNLYNPVNFDYRDSVKRIESFAAELEQKKFTVSGDTDAVQDATFFAGLYLTHLELDVGLCVRFSCFGELATAWVYSVDLERETLPKEKLCSDVVRLLDHSGFVYVPVEILAGAYSGDYLDWGFKTWWDRFFDYT